MSTVTRFAPSPTGRLHLGHVLSAAFARDAARADGGRYLVRIEDIDAVRCRPEFTAAILDDLAWLGLGSDGPVLRQSTRFAAYRAALDRLRADGTLYPCFCTRADIAAEIARAPSAPQGPDGPLYPGICRGLDPAAAADRVAAGAPHAWRIDVARAIRITGPLAVRLAGGTQRAAKPDRFGDAVLARKDVAASYHLAVTVDDAHQGVTLVTRGVDLEPAADLHRLLQSLLDLPAPAYAFHRLLADASGRRFAKRDGAATVAGLRAAGHAPEAILAMAQKG
jgi:glutamyl-Q tRNA(Asp) synthetase